MFFHSCIFFVEQEERFGRNPVHVLFCILLVSLGIVIITVLVALIRHFQKHREKSGKISNTLRIQKPYLNSHSCVDLFLCISGNI